jgi:hypothetical protein
MVSDASAVVTGDVKILAHYFEDGNIQLQTHKIISPGTVNGNTEAELSAAIITHIKVFIYLLAFIYSYIFINLY